MKKLLLTAMAAIVCCVTAFAADPTPVQSNASITTGSTYDGSCEGFTIAFKTDAGSYLDGMNVCTVNSALKITLKNGSTTFESSSVTAGWFGTVIWVKFEPAVKTPGVYDVIVPEGIMLFSNGTKTNAAVTLKLTITASSVTVTQAQYMAAGVTIDPADNSSISSKTNQFTLVNILGKKFEILNGNMAVLTHPDGTTENTGLDLLDSDSQIRVQFINGLDEPGDYTLRFPENTFKTTLNDPVGETNNPELIFTYRVPVPVDPNANLKDVTLSASSLNPATSANSFSEFYVTLKSDGSDIPSTMMIVDNLVKDVIVKGSNSAFIPSSVTVASGAASTIRLAFSTPITAGGTYDVVLPAGLVKWGDYSNKAATLSAAFTCTGAVVDYFSKIDWSYGSMWSTRMPVQNMTLQSFGGIYGEFSDFPEDLDLSVAMTDEDPDDAVSLKNVHIVLPDGTEIDRSLTKVVQTNNAFRFTASYDGAYKIPGDYKITIPAGSFTAGVFSNPEIQATFTVEDTRVFTPIDLPLTANPDPALTRDQMKYTYFDMNNVDGGKHIYNDLGIKYGAKAKVVSDKGATYEFPIVSDQGITSKLGFGFYSESIMDTPGTYTVTIPEGSYLLETVATGALVTNKEITVTYKVKGTVQVANVTPTVSPEAGTVVSLKNFEFFRPSGYQMDIPETPVQFEVSCPDGSVVKATPYTNGNVAGDYAFLDLPNELKTPGVYTLTIPQGGFIISTEGSANGLPIAEQTYEYVIISSNPTDLVYTATPASGSKIYSLATYVYVKFEEAVGYVTGSSVQLITPSGEKKQARCSFNKGNNRLMLEFGYDETDFGTYQFVIPQGTVYNEKGDVNKEIKLYYEYTERQVVDVPFIITPTPGKVAYGFDEVTFTAPDDYTVCERQYSGITAVNFYIDDNDPTPLYLKSTTSPLSYRVEFKEAINERCDVNIEVPESTFFLTKADGTQEISAAMRLTWSVRETGSVDGIYSEDGLYTVYTINGTCVMTNVEAEELNTLSAGIYIINGRTVIIR